MQLAVVIGANGFLGSAIVNELINRNIDVLAVYNSHFDNINKQAKLINNEHLLDSNIQPDYIFYLPGNYATSHENLLKINYNLYKYSLKFYNSRFVYISSTNVYGNHDDVITENSAFVNPSLYGLSKLSGEFIVSNMSHYSIVRLTYIFGPGISNNSFIPQIIKSAKNLGQITLFGNGSRMQDYIYIDDAVNLCINSSLIKSNTIYLGATGKSTSNKEVAEEIKKYIPCNILYRDEDLGSSFQFNPKKTCCELNWHTKISIHEGLKKMLI